MSMRLEKGKPANVVTVAPYGGDYTSIQDAVDAASAGKTVLVHPGTYDLGSDAITMKAGVSIIGVDREKCIITSENYNNQADTGDGVIHPASNCQLTNLTIQNTDSSYSESASGSTVVVFSSSVDDFTMTNCKTLCNMWSIYSKDGTTLRRVKIVNNELGGSNPVFFEGSWQYCDISHNRMYNRGVGFWCQAIVDSSQSKRNTTYRNRIAHNTALWIRTGFDDLWGGIMGGRPYAMHLTGWGNVVQGNKVQSIYIGDGLTEFGPVELITVYVPVTGYTAPEGETLSPTIISDNTWIHEGHAMADNAELTMTGITIEGGAVSVILSNNCLFLQEESNVTVSWTAANINGTNVIVKDRALVGPSGAVVLQNGATITEQLSVVDWTP